MASQTYGGATLGVADFLSTERLYVDPDLYMERANKYPFLTWMLQQGIVPVGDWTFNHHTKNYVPEFTTVNHSAGYNSAATTITVTDATVFRVNDLVENFTSKEVIRITGIASATSLTIARSLTSTAAATIADGAYLIRLSPAARHGEAVQEFATLQAAAVANYVQHFRKAVRTNVENTGVQLVGGNRRDKEQAEKLTELMLDIDRQIILGEGGAHVTGKGSGSAGATLGYDASTHHPLYMSHGIRGKASSYVYDNHASNGARQTITETTMNSFLQSYAHAEALGENVPFFISQNVMSAFNVWGRGKLRYGPSDVIQGIQCAKYQGNAGTVELIVEPNLKDWATNVGYDGFGFSLIPGQAMLVQVDGHGLDLHENIVQDGTAQIVDEWRWGLGLVVINEKYVSYIHGISTGA
jgi:hypothetical protein